MKTSQSADVPIARGRQSEEDLTLDDLAVLIPVSVLQQAQDAFSSALNIPLLFSSSDGTPVTTTSGLEMFCSQFAKNVEAIRPCMDCDRQEAVSSQPIGNAIHTCPLGLSDVAFAITAEGRTVGYLVTSHTTAGRGAPQVVQSARKQGMAPPAAISYASRIPVWTVEQLRDVAKGLSALAEIISQLATTSRRLKRAEMADPVTGVAGRALFWDALTRDIAKAAAHNCPFSVAMVNIDNLDEINDTYGLEAGDKALRTVAQVLTNEIRASDTVGRSGSGEFLVLLRCTDTDGAEIVSWRLKNKVAGSKFASHKHKVSVSARVATVTYPHITADNPDSLYKELKKKLFPTEEGLELTDSEPKAA